MVNYYDPIKTLIKALLDFLKILCGGGVSIVLINAMSQTADALPETWDDFAKNWPLLVIALIVGLIRAATNYYKNKWRRQFRPNGRHFAPLFIGVLVLTMCAGCVTSSTRERSIDADGSSYDFHYRATSAAAPFGKINESVHHMTYRGAGDDGGSLAVGQDSSGIDNSGQIAAIQAAGQIAAQVVAAMIQGGMLGNIQQHDSSAGAGMLGTINARLEALEQIITRMQKLLELVSPRL